MTPSDNQGDGRRSEVVFTAFDVLQTRSLSQALNKLVLAHASVRETFARAKAFASEDGSLAQLEEHGGLIGLFSGHDEPLLPLRYFEELPFDHVPPARIIEAHDKADVCFAEWREEIRNYYETVSLRAETLIEILHSGQVIGVGHTVDGSSVRIRQSIWRHPGFYVEPRTGDVYDANTNPMTRRWTGVAFEQGVAVTSQVSREADWGSMNTITSDPKPSSGPPRSVVHVQTKITAFKECVAWLTNLMRSSPDKRTHTNKVLLEMARARWPGKLSERSFEDARAEAIRLAKALAWGAAGRPKKSPRRNRGGN
jgi:hypothetical protein